MTGVSSILPHGYIDGEGRLYRDVEVVPLSGREEELLTINHRLETASLVTAVLSRCVRRIGDITPVSEEVARSLIVADRQYLLLKLREATFGDQVRASIFCPWPDCGKRVSTSFSIEDIPVIESPEKGPLFKRELSPDAVLQSDAANMGSDILFRLPNGSDQEAVTPLLAESEGKALTALLTRCVLRIGNVDNPGFEFIARLSSLARMEIEQQMEAVAPRIEMIMDAGCPECGRQFTIPFNPQEILLTDLRISKDLLLREIHYLAYHYHWSEGEIMDMTREKRRDYIEVLTDEIERMNNAI